MQPGPTQESLELPPSRDLGLLAVALAGVSASGPLMAATAAPALAIAFWRNFLGAALTTVAAARRRHTYAAIDGRVWLTASVAGLFLALHFATWVPSVKYTSVASATALVATQSIFSGLIAAAGGRQLPRAAWAGIGVAVLGTAMIGGADFGVSSRAVAGDGLAVLGAVFAAAYVTAGGQARRSMSAALYTWVCYGVCAVILLVVCLVGGQPLGGYTGRAWLLILGVTLSAQLLGHTLLNVVLRSASATLVSLAILFETPGAAIIAGIWLHQHPPLTALPGLVLLFAGLVLVIRARPVAKPVTVDVD